MTDLTPEQIVLKHARTPNTSGMEDDTPVKLEGIHGEGLGTSLPNDGDYSDVELRALAFLHHAPWDFDENAHVWGPWMQRNHETATRLATWYRSCVHPKCGGVQDREGSSS